MTSDILFSFWQKRGTIDLSKGTIAGLLAKSTTHRCIDYYRTAANKPVAVDVDEWDKEEEANSEQMTYQPDPEALYDRSEQRSALLDAIAALEHPDADILIRKYYMNEPAHAIAKAFSMTVHSVETRLLRAKQKLKVMLGGDENG